MRSLRLLGSVSLAALCVACGSSDDAAPGGGPGPDGGADGGGNAYAVKIRDTAYGVPHILADDLPGAAAGMGWVAARDFGCILEDQIVRVRSERAKFFGPGASDANLSSDFGMLALGIHEGGVRGLAAQSKEIRASVDGYVAGFNHYLTTKALSAECDGEAWVRPLVAEDLFAYYYWLAQLASGDPLINAVAAAAPPGVTLAPAPQSFGSLASPHLGSNGWAIGADRTATGQGMLLANPHFPWEGNRKFHENHITVPGVMNVYGASLLGSPVVNIGFNENIGWTHTVTTAHHFVIYELTLVDGDPMSYLYDGQPRAMTSKDFTVDVKQPDGSTAPLTRTMWRSHYGPIVAISALTWSDTKAYSMRNANDDNFAVGEQWLRMDQAKSLADLEKVNEEVQGIPWVNTMAVDAGGTALYLDASRTPNLSDAALAAHEAALAAGGLVQIVDGQGATLLDGSDSANEWVDAGAPGQGIVPFSKSPRLERRDFVANANDSYWLTNPAAPLTGYSILFGKESTPRSARTRMNLMMLTEQTAEGASGADGKFTFEELSQVEFSDRASLVEVLLDQALPRCEGAAPVTVEGVAIDVTAACAVLKAWDRRFKLDSRGAVLFRETLAAATGSVFEDAFDPADPVATPKTLIAKPATGDDPVVVVLATAVATLKKAGFEPDVSIGEVQLAKKGAETIPIHGGTNLEGAFNIVGFNADSGTLLPQTTRSDVLSTKTGLTAEGYPINVGSSFMMVLEYTPDGPHASAVLSYSQSSDPASPHFADQTHLFSESKYRPVLFTEDEIAADPELVITELSVPTGL